MDQQKVYCYNCVHIVNPTGAINYKCDHPSNKTIFGDWYTPISHVQYKRDPSDINRNNDCPNWRVEASGDQI